MPVNCIIASIPCLSLWERWPSSARTERANKLNLSFKSGMTSAASGSGRPGFPSQSPYGDSFPRGRAKGLFTKMIQKRNCTGQFLFYCIRL